VEKECRGRVNMVQILCILVYKWKNEICWNYFRNEGGGIKENDEVGEFIFDIVHSAMYPQHNNNKKKLQSRI
jgi:hypothetical protein